MSDSDYVDAETYEKACAELTRLRTLLFEVASAGIEYAAPHYVLVQIPTETWDALETLAQEGKP